MEMTGKVQNPADRYPKGRRFLLVIHELTTRLSPVQYVHPPDRFHLADLSQVSLGGFQVLVPQNYLGDDLQRNAAPACMGG